MTLTLVPYIRTSTDDKGQNPERQMSVIRAWAQREHVDLLPPEIDEGTSASKTSPFQRRAFVIACERAKRAGANGIVVESDDRFSRQGSQLAGHAEVEMRLVYGLELYRADATVADHGSLTGDLVSAVKTILAREWTRQHAARVKQGIDERRLAGLPVGRKPKELTEAEIHLALRLRDEGLGWPLVGVRVSNARGANDVADPKVRLRRMVSGRTVERAVKRFLARTPTLDKTTAHYAAESEVMG